MSNCEKMVGAAGFELSPTLGDDIGETCNLLSILIAALTFVNPADDWLTQIDEQVPAIPALSEAAREA